VSARIIVTGTDTGIGKTVFAAGLTRLLDGVYFKPVQAGLEGETDTSAVQRLSGLPAMRLLPEIWRLKTAASPDLAAERDGVSINPEALTLPIVARPLIVEGAGGLMVPLTRDVLLIDVFARWGAPVVLCARTTLGTINHTLLSLEALQRRGIAILGVALIGDAHPDNERTLGKMGGVSILGRLPHLNPLTPQTLKTAFETSFQRESFAGRGGLEARNLTHEQP
jgi:dethiobiotin synthetase